MGVDYRSLSPLSKREEEEEKKGDVDGGDGYVGGLVNGNEQTLKYSAFNGAAVVEQQSSRAVEHQRRVLTVHCTGSKGR